MASWNLRALIHSDILLRRKKLDQFNRIAMAHSMTIAQEVHGNLEEVERISGVLGWRNNFHWWFFPVLRADGQPQTDAGGIFFLVKKYKL